MSDAKTEGGKDAYTRDKLQEIASLVDEELPDGWGFFIMAFPFNDKEGRMNYVSNAQRPEILTLMKEFIKRSESQTDLFKHHVEKDPLSRTSSVEPYTDTDLMNFGKHKNLCLQDVPAAYLHWLWTERPLNDKRLEEYIRINIDSLKKEYPDGIWS